MRATFLLHAIWMMLCTGSVAALKVVRGSWRAVTNRRCSVDICREVIASQANVLIHPEGRMHRISDWKGRIVNTSATSFTPVLPFVGRHSAVTSVVNNLLLDLRMAEKIDRDPECIESLRLVGSSAPHGSGQTSFARVIHECLHKAVGQDQEVIYCRIDTAKSMFHIWTEDIGSQPGMKGLNNSIDKAMSLRELLQETQRFLAAENRILFLHFDDLVPFKRNGEKIQDSPQSFHDFWKNILKKFICTPRVCLYFSGQMPYFDNVSDSHVNAFDFDPVEVGPLEPSDIHSALSKMFVADPAGQEQVVRLSEILDGEKSDRKESASWELAQLLHALTAGVPLYVEHALHALLADSAFSAAKWRGEDGTALASRLSAMLNRDGAAYNAVRAAAQAHFIAQFTAAHGDLAGAADEARREHLAHLLDLVLLQGKTLKLTYGGTDANYLRWAKSRYMFSGGIATLLPKARMWGVHRTFVCQSETITFHIPPAVRDGLMCALSGVAELKPILRQLRRDASVADRISIRAVETALAFHHRVGQAAKQANWLGLVKDFVGGDGVVRAPDTGRLSDAERDDDYFRSTLRQPASWKLLRLPPIYARGKSLDHEAIAAIVNGEGAEQAASQSCNPSSAGCFFEGLSERIFNAMAARPGSTCADFVVRFDTYLTHVHVLERGPVTPLMMLRACVATLPLKRADRNRLQHTIAFIVSEREARAAAVREFPSLSRGALATLLTAAAKAEADVGAETHEGSAASAAAVVPVAEASKAAALVKNTAAVADLLRNGTFTVVVLNDAQLARFFRHNEVVGALMDEVVGSA